MSTSFYQFFAPVYLSAMRIWRLGAVKQQGLNIALFHDIPHDCRMSFENLIAHLAREHGFVSPNEAEAWLLDPEQPLGQSNHPAPFLLTFDDGFISNYEVAVDSLARYNIRALFFVCPKLIELKMEAQPSAICEHLFEGRILPQHLCARKRLMTWAQIRELLDLGHSIGCHGLSHRRLSSLQGDELRREIIGAGELLESRLGQKTPWYAFAFGDISSISADALVMISERFRFCRSGIRGLNLQNTSRLGLYAESLDLNTPLSYQKLILEGGLDCRYKDARKTLATILPN